MSNTQHDFRTVPGLSWGKFKQGLDAAGIIWKPVTYNQRATLQLGVGYTSVYAIDVEDGVKFDKMDKVGHEAVLQEIANHFDVRVESADKEDCFIKEPAPPAMCMLSHHAALNHLFQLRFNSLHETFVITDTEMPKIKIELAHKGWWMLVQFDRPQNKLAVILRINTGENVLTMSSDGDPTQYPVAIAWLERKLGQPKLGDLIVFSKMAVMLFVAQRVLRNGPAYRGSEQTDTPEVLAVLSEGAVTKEAGTWNTLYGDIS